VAEGNISQAGFEVFDPRTAPSGREPSATIQQGGLIYFNLAAFVAMGEPEAVELLFNRQERIVALRPTNRKAARAYAVRRQRKGGVVTGQAFATFHGLDVSVARTYVPQLVEKVLYINLNRPVNGPAGGQTKSKG